jgi:Tol biopolymer transport system component
MYDDGSEQLQSTENVGTTEDSQPSWDPLGEYMAIQTDRNGDYQVATMYYDGFEYTDITQIGYAGSGNSNDSSPDWEPVDDGVYCGE